MLYRDWRTCLNHIIRDSFFTCNTRWLHDAYGSTSSWRMQYNYTLQIEAVNALDIVPLYINDFADTYNMISIKAGTALPTSSISLLPRTSQETSCRRTRRTWGSFARNGDSNPGKVPGASSWPAAAASATASAAMMVSELKGWHTGTDSQTADAICGFWTPLPSR